MKPGASEFLYVFQVIRERKLENQKKVDIIIDDSSLEVRKRRRLAFLDLLIEVQKQHGDFTDEAIQGEVSSFMFAVKVIYLLVDASTTVEMNK